VRNAIAPGTSPGQNHHLEITQLSLNIQIAIAFKNYGEAKRLALQLPALSRLDPNWYKYPESFQVACYLAQLTDPRDRIAWSLANRGILEAYPGATEGSMRENQRTVARAAAALLDAEAAGPPLFTPAYRGDVASLLLVVSGVAPGAERVAWAKQGLRESQRSGSGALSAWSVDNITPRFAAVGVCLAGDWKAGAAQYDRVVAQGTGAMNKTLAQAASSTRYGGLMESVAGITTVESEAATAFAMSGQVVKALDTLEHARRNTLSLSARGAPPPGAALPAVVLEDRLARAGAVVVQPIVSLIGAFVLVSVLRKGKLQRVTNLDVENGGMEISARMIASSAPQFFKDGLGPLYQRVRRTGKRDFQKKMAEYVARASKDAQDLIGKSLREALVRANVSPTEDVLVILPANLAILPISLARSSPADAPLGERYQLRFAESLTSAWQAQQAASRTAATSPSVAIVAQDARASGLTYAELEVEAVAAAFPGTGRQRITPTKAAALSLSTLEGAKYWHVASHGAWDYRDPKKSGIALSARQVITVADILALRMTAPPRLVYLSACETGLIDVEHDLNRFVGLPSALLTAGAAGAIGSLWPVDDAATALISSKFYDEHLTKRAPPATALRRAQQWLRLSTAGELQAYLTEGVARGRLHPENAGVLSGQLIDMSSATKPYEDPYFWGGFQLFGI